jgi:hypothetical protein
MGLAPSVAQACCGGPAASGSAIRSVSRSGANHRVGLTAGCIAAAVIRIAARAALAQPVIQVGLMVG